MRAEADAKAGDIASTFRPGADAIANGNHGWELFMAKAAGAQSGGKSVRTFGQA